MDKMNIIVDDINIFAKNRLSAHSRRALIIQFAISTAVIE